MAGVTIGIAVLVGLSELALVHVAVAKTGAIVLRCFLIGTIALVVVALARSAIFAALFDSLVETSVQGGLTQMGRATEIAVTIFVATEAVPVIVVVTVPAISVAPVITLGVKSVFESFTEVTAVEFAVAET